MRPADNLNVKIETITRLRNSYYGNPRFEITFTDGSTHRTQSDASIAYEITNREFRGLIHVWLSRRGTIEYAVPAEGGGR